MRKIEKVMVTNCIHAWTKFWHAPYSTHNYSSTQSTQLLLTVVHVAQHLLVDVVVQVHARTVALALHEARRVQNLDVQRHCW